jgi:hypothetical protein
MKNSHLALLALLLSAFLFLGMDIALSQFGWLGLIRDPILRIPHPVYHHGLTPGLCSRDSWGPERYQICTNSLGFLDESPRAVALAGEGPRLLIIGDSFAEGVGLNWRETFPGRFAKEHPEMEVLNAGVSSYSPTIYHAKVTWLLEQGLRFDHLLVFIDISDIMDETWYRNDENGNHVTDLRDPPESPLRRQLDDFANRHLKATTNIFNFIADLFDEAAQDPRDRPRSAWTYGDWNSLASHYAPIGISAAIKRAQRSMDRLSQILKTQDIALSVAVYPWPGQLAFDRPDSLQAKIWHDWCLGKCTHFINLFPDFFAYKQANPQSWYVDLFIQGDVHFNARGNAMIAQRLGDFSWSRGQ